MIADGNLFDLLNPAAAFAAGALVSLHCVGMCGPLSCALIGGNKGGSSYSAHALYHLGRLASYSLLGALAGGLGERLVSWLGENPARFAPWAMVGFFGALALNLDGALTRWQAKRGFGRSILQHAYRMKGSSRGLSLGLLTPLIPCGPLYLMLWATALSGSAGNGALVMAFFTVGTTPLMFLAQSGWSWFATKVGPSKLAYFRRGLALVAVAVLCMRAFVDVDASSVVSGEGICK